MFLEKWSAGAPGDFLWTYGRLLDAVRDLETGVISLQYCITRVVCPQLSCQGRNAVCLSRNLRHDSVEDTKKSLSEA
jgi:hypothetical protein